MKDYKQDITEILHEFWISLKAFLRKDFAFRPFAIGMAGGAVLIGMSWCSSGKNVNPERFINKPEAESEVHVRIETSRGNLRGVLYATKVPIATANFIQLAKRGFYDGCRIHTLSRNLLLETGDPLTKVAGKEALWGTGGPGYTFEDEFRTDLQHDELGVLSMVNFGPNTNGSQFLIALDPLPQLDNKNTIFGKITEGRKILQSLNKGDVIKKVTIEEPIQAWLASREKERIDKWEKVLLESAKPRLAALSTPVPAPISVTTPTPTPAGLPVVKPESTPPPGKVSDIDVTIFTSRGELNAILYATKTPLAAVNFINLAEKGFFDETRIHGVFKDLYVEMGDPLTKENDESKWGTGGPGYTFPDEIHPQLVHDQPGILSMINSGRNANGSKFLITLEPVPDLDGKNTVFGMITRGRDLLYRMKKGDRILGVTIHGNNEFLYYQQRSQLREWNKTIPTNPKKTGP